MSLGGQMASRSFGYQPFMAASSRALPPLSAVLEQPNRSTQPLSMQAPWFQTGGMMSMSGGGINRPEQVQMTSARGGGDNEKPVVQFSSDLWIVEEDDDEAFIDVIRLGNADSRVSCYFTTEDGSAKAGERYEANEGPLVFEPGETRKTISVTIIGDDKWAATLEFKVLLNDAVGCTLGNTHRLIRVKVIDTDTFPSSKYPQVANGPEGIGSIGTFPLFWEYVKMNFHEQGMRWRTLLCILFDQMRNAYLFYKLSAMAYMLNTLFSDNDVDKNPSFTIDMRVNQAIMVGLGYILPMLLLHVWDLVRIQVDIKGKSTCFIQQNIVRKYLNYNQDSRSAVAVSDIQLAVREDAADMADGYLAVLSLLKLMGKLWVIVYFTLQESPDALIYVITMPAIMFIFGCCRNSSLVQAQELPDSLGNNVIAYLGDVSSKYEVVSDYAQRPKINDEFAKRLAAWQIAELKPRSVRTNNDYFTQWLGPTFIGVYIMMQARNVLTGALGHGTFIATLNVFSEISSDFSEGYSQFMKISSMAGCLAGLTELLNRKTDLQVVKTSLAQRKEGTIKAREKLKLTADPNHPCPDDLMPLTFCNVGFQYEDSGESDWALKGINLSVPQGTLVAIQGPHGRGRQSFLKLIGHTIFPTEGEIIFPEHLKILHVAHDILILEADLEHNLTFGVTGAVDQTKMYAILKKLKVSDKLIKFLKEEHLKEEHKKSVGEYLSDESDEENDEERKCWQGCCKVEDPSLELPDTSWQKRIAATDKAKLHLARALLVNPQVMALQRPLIHFNETERMEILKVLREHVENRGLGMPPESVSKRRPRTVFLSVETDAHAQKADVILQFEVGTSAEVWTVTESKRSIPPSARVAGYPSPS